MKMAFIFMFKEKQKILDTFQMKTLELQSLVFIHLFCLLCISGTKKFILRLEVVKVKARTKFDFY